MTPVLEQPRRDLLGAAKPALGQVRAAAGVDRGGRGRARSPWRRRRLRGLDDHVHDIVVGDDAEPVAIVQAVDRLADRPPGEVDLLARHRARPIEHEREVDRQPLAPALGGRGGDLGEHEAVAAGADADQGPVGPDGRGWWGWS